MILSLTSIPEVLWRVDDVRLPGVVALAGRAVWCGGAACWTAGRGAAAGAAPLEAISVAGFDRAAANRLAVNHLRATYGLWR